MTTRGNARAKQRHVERGWVMLAVRHGVNAMSEPLELLWGPRSAPGFYLRLLAAGALLAALVFPTSFFHGGPHLDAFAQLTGIPSPSCGLTRSWSHLLHGDLSTGLTYHPLGPITIAIAVLLAFGVDRRFPQLAVAARSRWSLIASVAVVLTVWLVRLWTGSIWIVKAN
jgi:hypothetical protein